MKLRFLFFKHALEWPRASGHDVHTAGMMRALASLGHDVHLVTTVRPSDASIAGLGLSSTATLGEYEAAPFAPSWLQQKFFDYWGVPTSAAAAIAAAATHRGAEVVVAVGLDAPLHLAAVNSAERVWYTADEWVIHHLSQVDVRRRDSWENVTQAFVKGLYERAFSSVVDRAWVVSDPDRRAARWLAGIPRVDVIPNGVDGEHFQPRTVAELQDSVVFWGRLDFGPNIQALQWFVGTIWPEVRRRRPSARCSILGFRAVQEVSRLAEEPGVRLVPDLPDLREEICRHQVAIVPMVSGAGIKNKLLEAASLARPIVCTPRATLGLALTGDVPFVVCHSVGAWSNALAALWDDPDRRVRLGRAGRSWARSAHTWTHAASLAVAALTAGGERRPREATA